MPPVTETPGSGTTDTNPNPTDTAVGQQALSALLDILRSSNSPEVREAQTILLRRLALQGDVIASRVPAPRNITEIGGYLNLLTNLGEAELRAQTLAGILGVAGPNPPLGWIASGPAVTIMTLANDRPAGLFQAAIPLTFAVRSDFASAVEAARQTLHQQGAALPLLSNFYALPAALPGTTPPGDPLPYLGRVLEIVPAVALRDAASDPILLARSQGTTDPFAIMARVTTTSVGGGPGGGGSGGGSGGGGPGGGGPGGGGPGSASSWDVLVCNATSCTPTPVTADLVPVAPVLATAGFYPASPLPEPTSSASIAWARFTNVTGLVAGVTKLGDELSLVYRTSDILTSAFASRLHWVWDGTAFGAP